MHIISWLHVNKNRLNGFKKLIWTELVSVTHWLSVRIEGLVCSVVNVVNGLPENWRRLVSRRRQSGTDAVTIVLLSSPTFSFDCWWLGSTKINGGRTPQRVVQNVHWSDPCQIGTGFVSAPLAGVMPKQPFLVTLHSKILHTSRIFLVNCLHRRLLLPVT